LRGKVGGEEIEISRMKRYGGGRKGGRLGVEGRYLNVWSIC
jgi:hypothetical protein